MAEYAVKFMASAAKEFRTLSVELKHRIGLAVDGLRKDPRPHGVRKVQGHKRLYRVRVGQYRVVYEIDDQAKLVRVTKVRHRKEAY